MARAKYICGAIRRWQALVLALDAWWKAGCRNHQAASHQAANCHYSCHNKQGYTSLHSSCGLTNCGCKHLSVSIGPLGQGAP